MTEQGINSAEQGDKPAIRELSRSSTDAGIWLESIAMSERSGWQLAGETVAEAYERYIMAAFGNAWAQALVQVAAPEDGDRVLDVACGTGAVARYAAPHVGPTGRVTGLDLNAGMLATARTMPAPAGIPIAWHEGNATALPFPNASFDIVCCQQGLQFFPDRPAALREMSRVLTPGGRLALAVWRGLEHQPSSLR